MNSTDNQNGSKSKYGQSTTVTVSTANRKVYHGIFADKYGNPNVKYYGTILEALFTIFGVYLLATQKFKYAVFFIISLAIGSILNGIRFYYVNPLVEERSDAEFLDYVIYANAFNVIVCILALFYILFIKK